MKKLFALLLLFIFMAGVAPFAANQFDAAEARPKKKIVRKKKRVVRKKKRRPARIVRSGPISQRYLLKEGADQSEAAGLIEELKATGVEEASFDVDQNVLQVKYNVKNLSAIDIIKKLKDLGYAVKQIN